MFGPSCLSHVHPEPAPHLLLVVKGAHAVLAGEGGVNVEDGQVVQGTSPVKPVAEGRRQSRGTVKPTDI